MPPIARTRFHLLDLLRFVAAFAVLAYHFTAVKTKVWGELPKDVFPGLSQFTAYGALGVHLFFVISGFVILMSAQGRSVGQFVASRVSRLYPAYWVSVLAACFMLFVLAPGMFKRVTPSEALVNLTMVQEGFGVAHVDGVYWTLWVELLFYVLIGLFLAVGMNENRILAFAFLWPLVAAMAQQAGSTMLASALSPNYAPFFSAGMTLFLIHRSGHSLLKWLILSFNVCLGTFQASSKYVEGSVARHTGIEVSGTVGALIVLGVFALVALVTISPISRKGASWMAAAGALTYPLYLFHELWGWWIISQLHSVASKWAVLAIATACVLLIAWFVQRLVERPLGKLLSTTLKKEAAPPARRTGRRSATRIE